MSTEIDRFGSIRIAGRYCAVQWVACAVSVGPFLRQRRAASISASVAPWLLAHISAADSENLAT
jgi:ABC-type transport system involved in cytochrome c biogenesis permease subunit